MSDPNPDPPPLVEEIRQFEENCCLKFSLARERLQRKWGGIPEYNTELVFAEEGNLFKSEMYSYMESQGYRPYMEDRHIATAIADETTGFFTVLDGHGLEGEGHMIAEYTSKQLAGIVDKHYRDIAGRNHHGNSSLARDKIDRAFSEMDSTIRRLLPNTSENNGTTVTSAFIDSDYITFANVGDSRGILINQDYTIDYVTLDHKPTIESENARVLRAGGFVDDLRVNGDLAVSRTLGDVSYKPANAPRRLCPISNEPDVTKIKRLSSHRCVLLGSDGIWDALSSQEVVDLFRQYSILDPVMDRIDLQKRLDSCYRKILSKATGDRLSSDNITLFFVVLTGFDSESVKKDSPTNEQQGNSNNTPTTNTTTTGVEIELT